MSSIEIKQDMDFNDLMENCWGQAIQVLKEIYEKDKEQDFMDLLLEEFVNIPDLTEINDFIAYEWEYIYSQIGMNDEDEDEDEE